MNNEFNVKSFVDEYLERIINMKDKELGYEDLQRIRESIIERNNLNINEIDYKEIVDYIKESEYVDLFDNINLDEAANIIFLKKLESKEIVEIFDSMTTGINEKNYLRKIYTQNETFQDEYGIDLSDLEKFFKNCKYHLKFEIMGNMATFIEAYYGTEDGKKFIESYQELKNDESKKDQYFRAVFDKMNDASIRKIFHTDNDGHVTYSAAGAGTLDGFFILFDKNNNLSFNVSTTASPDVKIEGTSILRHALTSKLISEAIVEEIDRRLIENKDYNPIYDDNKEELKKMRSLYWEQILKSDKGYINEVKNDLIGKAIIAKIKESSFFKISESLEKIKSLNSGKTIESLIKELNSQNPVETINKKLNKTGNINESKMREFFNTKNEEFQTNFISEIKGLRDTKKFEKSGLKALFESAKINMYEFKTFLQNSALKNITLESYNERVEKEAIDYFYDHVITRRVFASANQVKINLDNFAKSAERLFCNVFVLPQQETVNEYLRCLNGIDYSNICNHLNYTIQKGSKIANDDILPALHVKEKLNELKLNVDVNTFLDRVSVQYNLPLADFLQSSNVNFEKRINETQRANSLEEELARLREEIAASKKESKINTEDECDYSGQIADIQDVEKNTSTNSILKNKEISKLKK